MRKKKVQERITAVEPIRHCSLCGTELNGYPPDGGGNGTGCNPWPLLPDREANQCCDKCDREKIQPARLARHGSYRYN